MKKRFNVIYTTSVDETMKNPRYSRAKKGYTNKSLALYNEILIGKNLKYKDALTLVCKFEVATGFFSIEHNDKCVLFGGRTNNTLILTNNSNASFTYTYSIKNKSLYYPEIIL